MDCRITSKELIVYKERETDKFLPMWHSIAEQRMLAMNSVESSGSEVTRQKGKRWRRERGSAKCM